MQEWGLEIAKESSICSAAVKYTEFLLATASGKVEGVKGPGKLATPFERTKVAAYTLGAMTPCMRLYAFLGKEFKALLDPKEGTHPYKKWIDNYSSESFQVCDIIFLFHLVSTSIVFFPSTTWLLLALNLGVSFANRRVAR
jgi:hypothetical protein